MSEDHDAAGRATTAAGPRGHPGSRRGRAGRGSPCPMQAHPDHRRERRCCSRASSTTRSTSSAPWSPPPGSTSRCTPVRPARWCDRRQVVSALAEPHRQRGEVRGAGEPGDRGALRCTTTDVEMVPACVTPASGPEAVTSSASSNASTASTRPQAATPEAPGSGLSIVRHVRTCGRAATSPWSPSRARAPPSGSSCSLAPRIGRVAIGAARDLVIPTRR